MLTKVDKIEESENSKIKNKIKKGIFYSLYNQFELFIFLMVQIYYNIYIRYNIAHLNLTKIHFYSYVEY